MPELPETETIARDLHAAIAGARITTVAVERTDILRGLTARTAAGRLVGRRIERAWRRAKSVVLSLDDASRLVVTPRFTGALLVAGASVPDAYSCLRLVLDDGRELRYRDVRRLGTVAWLDGAAFARWDASLGPEPLADAFDVERLSECLWGTRRTIKAVLMDQKRLAGVGNIYANEALWRARIRPSRRACALTAAQRDDLHRELVAVLREAIDARGTSFRDYRDSFGGRGAYAAQLKAYGRGGLPCHRCGTLLRESHAIGGRTTVWCTRCQG